MSKKITKDSVVTIHYTLKGDDGVVLDSSEGQEPLVYLHGHGQIVPGLESELNTKEIGAKLAVKVSPDEGYGDYDPKLSSVVDKKQFPKGAKFESGALYEFSNSNGQPVVVQITEVQDSTVTVDANHPLAGKTLHFEVSVVDVRPATKEELEHGHAHGPGGHEH